MGAAVSSSERRLINISQTRDQLLVEDRRFFFLLLDGVKQPGTWRTTSETLRQETNVPN